MTPAAIRALIHEHRAAGRIETVLVMEQLLAVVEGLALDGVHWTPPDPVPHCTLCALKLRAREVLA